MFACQKMIPPPFPREALNSSLPFKSDCVRQKPERKGAGTKVKAAKQLQAADGVPCEEAGVREKGSGFSYSILARSHARDAERGWVGGAWACEELSGRFLMPRTPHAARLTLVISPAAGIGFTVCGAAFLSLIAGRLRAILPLPT